jgi:hypothetical protein
VVCSVHSGNLRVCPQTSRRRPSAC